MTPELEKAKANYDRVAGYCDSAWQAYRAARAKQAKRRGVYATEQAVIDAADRVKAAGQRLDTSAVLLRSAAYNATKADMQSSARARLAPLPGPDAIRAALQAAMLALTNGEYD